MIEELHKLTLDRAHAAASSGARPASPHAKCSRRAPVRRILAGSPLRIAFRSLKKDTGVRGAAIVTLALAIGANTAIFSVIHAVLIDPLRSRIPIGCLDSGIRSGVGRAW